jgi:colanic acid/amylovoran biosynthesis glycosyltransferase
MNQPLRIAFFAGMFPVTSETFILRQITGLLDLGHDVSIFTDARGEAAHPEIEAYRLLERATFMEMPPETGVYEMPVRPLLGKTWPPGSSTAVHNMTRLLRALPKMKTAFLKAPRLARRALSRSEYGYQAESLSAIHRLARLCAVPAKFDVLHAHFGPVGNSFRFARELFRAPLVVSFHGYDFTSVPRREGSDVYQRLFATADLVTVNSAFTRGELDKLGCPSEKIVLLHVGLNPGEFKFRERTTRPGEPVRLLSVGRLVEVKGHEYAIRAVAKLRSQFADLRYEIIGEGPLRKALEELARELGVAGVVSFHGALGTRQVRDWLDRAQIFIMPSVTANGAQEGQGLALQEAQACGLPVVATRHGALPEGLIEGYPGFLVPERDADALAERIAYLLQHPGDWPRMGCEGRKFVEANYDIRQLNQKLVNIYRQAMKNYC